MKASIFKFIKGQDDVTVNIGKELNLLHEKLAGTSIPVEGYQLYQVFKKVAQLVDVYNNDIRRNPENHMKIISMKMVGGIDKEAFERDIRALGATPTQLSYFDGLRTKINQAIPGDKGLFRNLKQCKEFIEIYNLTEPDGDDATDDKPDFSILVDMAKEQGIDAHMLIDSLVFLFENKPKWFREWYDLAIYQSMRIELLSEYDITVMISMTFRGYSDIDRKRVRKLLGKLLNREVENLLER